MSRLSRGLFLFVVLGSATAADAQSVRPSDIFEYEVEEIATGVHVIHTVVNRSGFVNGNITVVIGDSGVLVVDAGFIPAAAELAVEEIRRLTDLPVLYVVNTHWHGDHWLGNSAIAEAWPEATFVASEPGYQQISTRGVQDLQAFVRNYSGDLEDLASSIESGMDADGAPLSTEERAELVARLRTTRYVSQQLGETQPILATLTFDERLIVRLGGREVHLHFLGEGNTRGDTVALLPAERIIITGDLVVLPAPYESGSFGPAWRETLSRMSRLGYGVLVPGHGDVQHDDRYLDMVIGIFDAVFAQVQALADQGMSLEQVQARVTFESIGESLEVADHWEDSPQLRYFVETGVRRTWQRLAGNG